MARPPKLNAEWFTHMGALRNDRRVKAIRTATGAAGYGIFHMLLEALTDADYTTLSVDAFELELLAGDFGVLSADIESLLNIGRKVGYFLIDENKMLTCPELSKWLTMHFEKRNRSKAAAQAGEKSNAPWLAHTAAVFARDGHRCLRCGSQHDLTLDHVIPRSKGGSDEPSNLQTLCTPCNSSKGVNLPHPAASCDNNTIPVTGTQFMLQGAAVIPHNTIHNNTIHNSTETPPTPGVCAGEPESAEAKKNSGLPAVENHHAGDLTASASHTEGGARNLPEFQPDPVWLPDSRALASEMKAYWHITEAQADAQMRLGRFCSFFFAKGSGDNLRKQFEAYREFKKRASSQPHNWKTYIGSEGRHYMDGAWNEADFAAKLLALNTPKQPGHATTGNSLTSRNRYSTPGRRDFSNDRRDSAGPDGSVAAA